MFAIACRRLAAAAMFLIVLILPVSPLAAQSSAPATSTAVFVPIVTAGQPESSADVMARRVIELTNQERAQYGCAPLITSAKLSASAVRHSRDMALHDRFSHIGSDGSTMVSRIEDAGYEFTQIAENIATGQSTPEDVVAAWMASTMGHRENILNCELREIGVGFYDQPDDIPNVLDDSGHRSGPYRFYWTQDFGTPQ